MCSGGGGSHYGTRKEGREVPYQWEEAEKSLSEEVRTELGLERRGIFVEDVGVRGREKNGMHGPRTVRK